MCAQDTHSERSRVAGGRGAEGTGKTEEKALQSERGDSGLRGSDRDRGREKGRFREEVTWGFQSWGWSLLMGLGGKTPKGDV